MNSASNPLTVARGYIERGWSPVQIQHKEKGPKGSDWPKLRITTETANQYFDGTPSNIGVILGGASRGLTDVDLDSAEAVALAPHVLPKTAAIFGRASRPASHWLYCTSLAETADTAVVPFKDSEKRMLVELRIGGAKGAQTVFPGSTHKTGEKVEWAAHGDPEKVDGAVLRQSVAELAACCVLTRAWPKVAGIRHSLALVVGGFMARAGLTKARAAHLVETIARQAGDNEPDDRKKAAQDAAQAFHDNKHTYGLTELRESFGEPVADRVAEWLGYQGVIASDGEDQPPAFTDEALALRFADQHAADLRYVAFRSGWLHYDGKRWQADNTLLAFNCARKLCRTAAKECNEPNPAKMLASGKTSSAVERLARADRKLAATNDQWDADQWLLNTPIGVIGLRKGEVRAASPADYMTKLTAVGPGGECPVWQQHLLRVMGGDVDLVAYLQRVFGYCLTGVTREHALFFAYGTGANGKSVTINTVAGILNDYQRTAPVETFTASQTDRHPTDLAGLQGARLVTAIETEEGRAWAESKIKMMTGGDPISARYMRQDFFEYLPQFKLFIAGNHKPALRSVDEAIRRRLHLIPFTETIPVGERDEVLTEKLKAEWPGILKWMIDGCIAWQWDGLNPPKAVLTATAEYLEAEDAMLAWLEDDCERDSQAQESTSNLYSRYRIWADRAGESAGSSKRFAQTLEARGFGRCRTKAARGFAGLRLKTSASGLIAAEPT
jgi:putative DNA primase/helicase